MTAVEPGQTTHPNCEAFTRPPLPLARLLAAPRSRRSPDQIRRRGPPMTEQTVEEEAAAVVAARRALTGATHRADAAEQVLRERQPEAPADRTRAERAEHDYELAAPSTAPPRAGAHPSHSRWFWAPAPLHDMHPAGPACRLRSGRGERRRARRAGWHGDRQPGPVSARPGQALVGDKNCYEAGMASAGITLLRPARKGEPPRAAAQLFKPLRQIIEPAWGTPTRQPGSRHSSSSPPCGPLLPAGTG
jgi:hypothetical protein